MVPAHLTQIDQIPLTRNGKLDKRALPQAQAVSVQVDEPAKSELESQVADVWCEVLELPQVGLSDNFFELGGNSLTLMQVFNRLSAQWPGELSVGDLFAWPTVRTIAAGVERRRSTAVQLVKTELITTGSAVGGQLGHELGAEAVRTGRALLASASAQITAYTGLAYWLALRSLSPTEVSQLLIQDAAGLIVVDCSAGDPKQVLDAALAACAARTRISVQAQIQFAGTGLCSLVRLPGAVDNGLPPLVHAEIDWRCELVDHPDGLQLRIVRTSPWAPEPALGLLATRTERVLTQLLADHDLEQSVPTPDTRPIQPVPLQTSQVEQEGR